MIGGPAGNVLSSAMLAVLGLALGEIAFAAWGWRIAFIASAVLIFIGVWMRTRVAESPVYQACVERRKRLETPPLGATLVSHWRSMLIVLLVKAGENALFYVFTTFYVVYITRVLRQPRTVALEAAAIGSVVDAIVIFAAGAWSDRIGRRVVTAIGFVAAAAWAFALFPLTRSGTFAAIAFAAGVAGACHGLIVGGMSAFFVELFPTSARYTAFSIGYQFATVFTGAIAPLIGVALLNAYGSTIPVSLYALAMTAPGLISLGMADETRGMNLDLDT